MSVPKWKADIGQQNKTVPPPPRSGEKVAAGRMKEVDAQHCPLTLTLSPVGEGIELDNRSTGERGQSMCVAFALVLFLTCFTFLPSASAQDNNEQFIPADQLDAVFDRDRRGVKIGRAHV